MDIINLIGNLFGIVKSIQNIVSVVCDTIKKCLKFFNKKKKNRLAPTDGFLYAYIYVYVIIIEFDNSFFIIICN